MTQIVDELITVLRFRGDRAELDKTTRATDRLAEKQEGLTEAIGRTEAAIAEAKTELIALNKQAILAGGKSDELSKKITRLRQRLAEMGDQAARGRRELKLLDQTARARERTERSIARTRAQGDRQIERMRAVAGRKIERLQAERGEEGFAGLRKHVKGQWSDYWSPKGFYERGGAALGGVRDSIVGGGRALIGGALTGTAALTTAAAMKGSSMEGLRAQLKTAVGDRSAAEFDRLQEFAQKTPFELENVVKAFVKLENQGLKNGDRALRSYGDTAGAMGKSLDDVTEAVLDAATGEFERLKELGIKSKTEGDKVTFTFRGVSTTVQKEAGAIQDYLIRLGEQNFAGGMEAQSKTLAGAISNMSDAFTAFLDNIFQGGLGDALKEIVADLTGVAEGSGDTAKAIGQILGDAVRDLWKWIKNLTGGTGEWGAKIKSVITFVTDAGRVVGTLIELLIKVADKLGGGTTAVIAFGAAVTALMGPIGALLAVAAGLGAALAAAFDDGTAAARRMQEETERAARQAELVKLRGEVDKLRGQNAADREAIARGERMLAAGFSDAGMEAAARKAGLAARRKALRGRRIDKLSDDERELVKLQVRSAMVDARLDYMNRAEAAGDARTGPKATKKKGKAPKEDTEYGRKIQSDIEARAKEAGVRAGIKAAAAGRSLAEQKAAARETEARVKENLTSRINRGESIPGELRQAALQMEGFGNVGRGQPPPIAVINVSVPKIDLALNFSGPVEADPRMIAAQVQRVVDEGLAGKLKDGLEEAASPFLW